MRDIELTPEPIEFRELAETEMDDVSGGISSLAFVYCATICRMILAALA